MKRYLLYSILILLAVLESSLIPVPITLLWILSWARVYDEVEAVIAAVIGGFVLDMLGMSPVGAHALIYIPILLGLFGIVRIGNVHRKTVITAVYTLVSVIAYVSLSTTLTTGTVQLRFSFWQLVVSALFFTAFLLIFLIAIRPKEQETLKLKIRS